MNKIHKITFPIIALSADKPEYKVKKKGFKGWMMNDTFSNWKKRKNNDQTAINAPEIVVQSFNKNQNSSKKRLKNGITLGQYFRTNTLPEQNSTQYTYNVANEQILPYLTQTFEIHETDQQNYEQNQNNNQLLNKPNDKIKQVVFKKVQNIKVQTQTHDQHSTINEVQKPLKKKSNSYRSKQKIEYVSQMQHSFQLKPRSKSRVLSNEVCNKLKVSESYGKSAILKRVKTDKINSYDIKNSNANLILKYENKFRNSVNSRTPVQKV